MDLNGISRLGAGVQEHALAPGDEPATRDSAEQLQQSPITWTVDARGTRDDDFEAGVGVGYYQRTVPSVYANVTHADQSEIAQDLKMRTIPVSFTARFLPLGRGSVEDRASTVSSSPA